jgi:Tol biopolymer transport system component/imidazolonepropionase-like amidohydrolase
MKNRLAKLAILLVFLLAATLGGEETSPDSDWNIETPPGVQRQQSIDVTEGTWVNLDVSPDGQTIVFDLLGDLYLMPIAGADGDPGNRPEKLTSGVSWDMQPRFSPDGNRIAFTSDRSGKSSRSGDNIWTIGVDGESLQQITNETFRLMTGPAWTPDGQYIVARKHFTSRRSLGAGEIWMYHQAAAKSDAFGGLQLTSRPNDQKDVNEPICSPDGRYIYFSLDATAGSTFEYDKDSHSQIYAINRLDRQTGEIETYISGPGGACRPTPSPDGKTIAFVRRVGSKTGLHLFDTQSGAIRLIYDKLERDMQEAWAIHGVYPTFAWTPDGKSIVVWAKGKIRRIQIDDGSEFVIPFRIVDERQITEALRFPVEVAPERFDVRMLRWVTTAPAGGQVAFQALGYLYLRDLPDGKERRLTNQSDHFEFYPSFSRDGRYLVYTTWNDEKLGSIRVTSVDPERPESWSVTDEPGHYSNPTFSPDGQTVVFEKRGGGHLHSPLWSRDQGLYRVDVHGGKATRISKSGRRPQFGADDARVFYQEVERGKDADNRRLCSVKLDGTDQRVHYTSEWATEYKVSPNGRWIGFIERFHVYLAPFVQTGKMITVAPKATGLPVTRVTEQAGEWIHFSGDSQKIHWSLGGDYSTQQLANAFGFLGEPLESATNTQVAPPDVVSLGFNVPHERPEGVIALVGGRIVTMDSGKVIRNGTVLMSGNRITAVGPRDKVRIPDGAKIVDVKGQVILPGFVDTHAHGAQASNGITPQQNWIDLARLSFGVTTIHDPSNDTHSIFAASEMTKAGVICAPRTFSTGTILYGAAGSYKADIQSLDDALFHLRRMQAVGAFTVKSYNQPRRDQRQQVLEAARQLKMMVVPEGGSTFMHNMTMIVDGHTGIEHTLPVQSAYDDVMDLWRGTGVGYTPTLSVAYGGISGERYWYEIDDLWAHPRLQSFIPPHILNPRSRRRQKAPLEDYNHIRVAEIARQVVEQGGLVQAGGHGQLNGVCTHWEMWSFVQGGMTPLQALECGTLNGAKYIGLDADLGSITVGKLADLVVIRRGHDPTVNIRDSEEVEYVVANGHIYDAANMTELGSLERRRPFYWEHLGAGIGVSPPAVPGCSCQR